MEVACDVRCEGFACTLSLACSLVGVDIAKGDGHRVALRELASIAHVEGKLIGVRFSKALPSSIPASELAKGEVAK